MPKLKLIEVWPQAGFFDRSWAERPEIGGRRTDAFVRSARAPSDALSQLTRERPIVLPYAATLQLLTREHDSEDVAVEIWEDTFDGPEGGRISLPPGLEDLNALSRRELAGETLLVALGQLLDLRGAAADDFDHIRDEFRRNDYAYRAEGPWKSSPNRRTKARLRFSLEDDGFGRIAVEFSGPDGTKTVNDLLGATTSESFGRAIRSTRWIDDATFTFNDGAFFDPSLFVVHRDEGLLKGTVAVPPEVGRGASRTFAITASVRRRRVR